MTNEKIEKNQEEINERRTRCEVYSRVVGYIRPIQQWNDGKQEEFKDRGLFDGSMSEN